LCSCPAHHVDVKFHATIPLKRAQDVDGNTLGDGAIPIRKRRDIARDYAVAGVASI
jgi:hypothetical protein